VALLSSGLRISEALSLKKDDFKERRLITEKGEKRSVFVVKVKGKFSKERGSTGSLEKGVGRCYQKTA